MCRSIEEPPPTNDGQNSPPLIVQPHTESEEPDPSDGSTINEHDSDETQSNADSNSDEATPEQGMRQPPAMNTTNLRTNIVFGNDMELPKDTNTTRLIALNVNGVRSGDDYQDVLEMAQAVKTHQVDWAAFGETNTDWKSTAKNKVYEKFNRIFHQVKLSTSSSDIKYKTLYQPGGTATIVTDDYTGRVTGTGSDTGLGRWSYLEILGSKGRTIILATVYQVCNQGHQVGSRTAHAQQTSLLLRQGRLVSPRKAFIDDFDKQVNTWLREGHELIIAGDLNEGLGNDINGFARISSRHNLVEIIQQNHGIEGEPPTYARGRRRLDYIFVTPGLETSVKRCGILPYSDILDSDHRCLYVDFDTNILLGGDPAILSPNPIRILHSRDKKGSEQYVNAVDRYMKDHRVDQRMHTLGEAEEADIEKGEAVDRDISRSMAHGMNKIRKLYISPFCPQIRHARLQRRFYKVFLSMLTNHLDLRRQLQSIQAAHDDILPEPRDLAEAQSLLRAAQQYVKDLNKKAAALRLTYLEEQAMLLESNNDPKAAEIRKRIIKAEELTSMFKKLRSYLRPNQHSNLNHVMTPADGLPPKEAQEWQRISDPNEIETNILDKNRTHFGQGHGTPFTIGDLGNIPFNGTGPLADSILAGTASSTDRVTQMVLTALKKPESIPDIPNHLTMDDFTGKLKAWKETTSTSPITKRHLGHYKCLIQVIASEQDSDNPDEVTLRAKRILNAHYNLLRYATKHGISLRRWRKVVNSMIEKEPGNPRIHRLRVIHLYEADYNLLLGIFWSRKLVPQGEHLGLFHENCYGSRPGRSATDPVTLEELQVTIAYLTRTNQIIFHNDATSCYDRIIINLANLLARRFGMSEALCRIHGDTLHHMLYYVATALGISERSYQHLPDSPIYGTGQGSCASPAIWLVVCSILFDCHQQASHGATYSTPDKSVILKLSMAGFVDDTKGQTNDMNSEKPLPMETLLSQMQDDAQLWGDLLHVSGGALEIPKCNFYIMHWQFDASGNATLDKSINQQLHLKTGEGTQVTLTNDSVDEPHKTLGTWKSAMRTQTKQYGVLLTKNNEYARIILSSPVTRRETWTAYYAVFLPRNTFILPTCYFSRKQLDRLQMKATHATLAKGGYSSTFPRAITYGPHLYGGLAMRPLWVEQLCQQTQTVVKHLRCPPGDCNTMFRIAFTWAQLSTGMGFHLMEYPKLLVPHLACQWFQSMRTGLAEINGSIECTENFIVPPAREGDVYIMDAVCDCKRYTNAQIRQINSCRLYLQVLLLSDIATPCGQQMATNYYRGNREQRRNRPNIKYPRQGHPNPAAWQLWRRALNLLYLQHDKKSLQQSMGEWHAIDPRHHRWDSYMAGATLFQSTADHTSYRVWKQTAATRRNQRFSRTANQVSTVPPQSQPIAVKHKGQALETKQADHFRSPQTAPTPSYDSLFDRIRTQPAAHQEILQDIELAIDEPMLQELLTQPSAIRLASDGGAVPGKGSFGWIIQVGNTIIARGKGPAYGPEPRSFRAEGYGMASGLLFLSLIKQHFDLDWNRNLDNHLICDNEGLLIRIEKTLQWKNLYPNVTLRSEWDIESVILTAYRQLGWQFQFVHVKSHQDKTTPIRDLPLAVQLNIEADKLATAYLETSTSQGHASLFPSAKCQLTIDNDTVSRKLEHAIRFKAGTGPIHDYMRTRNSWTQETLESIAWSAHGSSHSYHRKHRCFLIKLCHRHLPLGQILHRRDTKYPASCPGCGADTESHDHFIGCSAESRIKWRMTLIVAIRKQLELTQTDMHLTELVLNVIDRAIAGRPISVGGTFEPALRAQERIGWRSMLQGYWAEEWQQAYTSTYEEPETESPADKTTRKTTMARWQARLIRTIWTCMIALWKIRNDERHGRDAETREAARHIVLTNELELLYINRDQYPPSVRNLLRPTFEEHCGDKSYRIEDWLSAYRTTFEVMHIRPDG